MSAPSVPSRSPSEAPAAGQLVGLVGVSFSYRAGAAVLHDVSFAVDAGAGLAVLGPNGIGKSTLLAVMAGHLRPQSGAVRLAGRPLADRSPAEVARILGFVPQSEHLPFDYTCLEYALHGRAPYLGPLEMPGDDDVAIASACLERVGLGGFEERSINEVSGGERQLLMIARALTQQPRMLVLDEPTSHLDLANKRLVAGMLRELVARGVAVVLTTHEPEVAAAAATHIALMSQGRIIRSGPAAELMTTERLTETYGVPVRVVLIEGTPVVVWHRGAGVSP